MHKLFLFLIFVISPAWTQNKLEKIGKEEWKIGSAKKIILKRVGTCPGSLDLCGDEMDRWRHLELRAFDRKGTKLPLPPIECYQGDPLNVGAHQCDVHIRSDGRFYVVACFEHDAVLTTCSLALHDEQLKKISSFQPQLGIASLSEVTLLSTNNLKLTGFFQSQEIDGITPEQRNKCEGDCLGFDGIQSKATVVINEKGKIVSKLLLKP